MLTKSPEKVMTCTDGSFIDRWVNHMEGATRLIEVRGSDQLARREGLALFTQLRAQVVSSNHKNLPGYTSASTTYQRAADTKNYMFTGINLDPQPNIPGAIQLTSFHAAN